VSGSRAEAEAVVAQALVTACCDAASTDPERSVLHELSRLAFLYGDHTYREAGALLGLPPHVAAELLRLALLDTFRIVRTGLQSRDQPREA
jgi:hypothetical protein